MISKTCQKITIVLLFETSMVKVEDLTLLALSKQKTNLKAVYLFGNMVV